MVSPHISRKKNFSKNLSSGWRNETFREDKIAFPAVLGLESAAEIVKTISTLIEKPVFEIPTIRHPCRQKAVQCVEKQFSEKRRHHLLGLAGCGNRKTGKLIEAVVTQSAGSPNSLNARTLFWPQDPLSRRPYRDTRSDY